MGTPPRRVDWNRVSQSRIDDIVEFYDDNTPSSHGLPANWRDLTPEQALGVWLHWQGIIGYTSDINELTHQLGVTADLA